jgi:hypothetical protein
MTDRTTGIWQRTLGKYMINKYYRLVAKLVRDGWLSWSVMGGLVGKTQR